MVNKKKTFFNFVKAYQTLDSPIFPAVAWMFQLFTFVFFETFLTVTHPMSLIGSVLSLFLFIKVRPFQRKRTLPMVKVRLSLSGWRPIISWKSTTLL